MTAYAYDRNYDKTVPAIDEAKYRDWKRRDQWKRRASQSQIDLAILRGQCTDKPSCSCPICKEFGKMRQEAHGKHYLRGMDWPEAWRAAGWDGGAETPFMNPGDKLTPAEAAAPVAAPPRGWLADRFAEIDCLPSSNDSDCADALDVPVSDWKTGSM
jgi:hypothetical protein